MNRVGKPPINVWLRSMIGPGRGWLKSFDPEAHEGRGHVVLTLDRHEAFCFETVGDALAMIYSSPKGHPIRETDGLPNRPLTAYHAEIMGADAKPEFLS